MPAQPKVIALVATRLRSEPLARLLSSLHQQTARPVAAVICDNGSDPDTADTCKNSALPCELISPGKNLGYGGGLAAAGQRAFEKFPDLTHLLIVDDDSVLGPKDLASLLGSSAKHGAGAIAPFLLDAAGNLQEVPEPVSWSLARQYRKLGLNLEAARRLAPGGYPMAWCIGPCLLVDRSVWLRAGPPRSDMLAFGDDVEFSLRLSAVSPAWAEPSVAVTHAPPPTTKPASATSPQFPDPLQLNPNPYQEDAAHYKKFGVLLQNLAFTCVASPRPRHLPLYLPGNAKRFLATFGFSSANLLEVARRYLRGFFGIPGGR